MYRKNLTNKKFHRLIAITYNNGEWLCKCDCGNFHKVISGNLISGRVKSCGCLNIEKVITK